jgi:hypothetical protein
LESAAGFVVIAGTELKRLTAHTLANIWLVATCHNASGCQPLPSLIWIATTTTKLTWGVCKGVPRGQNDIAVSSGNAKAIVHGSGCAKGPTSSAIGLIANPTNDGCTLWPFLS